MYWLYFSCRRLCCYCNDREWAWIMNVSVKRECCAEFNDLVAFRCIRDKLSLSEKERERGERETSRSWEEATSWSVQAPAYRTHNTVGSITPTCFLLLTVINSLLIFLVFLFIIAFSFSVINVLQQCFSYHSLHFCFFFILFSKCVSKASTGSLWILFCSKYLSRYIIRPRS